MTEETIPQKTDRRSALARELLGMCVTMLAYEDQHPDCLMAQGPVLEIVRNVVASLDFMDADTPIGEAAREKRKRRLTKAAQKKS